MSSNRRFLLYATGFTLVAALILTARFTREHWQPWVANLAGKQAPAPAEAGHDHDHDEPERVKLTPQARRNLKLIVGPIEQKKLFWRTMPVPAVIIDRPGQSDRGVIAPVTGVVTTIHAYPSDMIKPGDALFTVRLLSEFVHNAQAELYKYTKDKQINDQQLKRLTDSSAPAAKVIEAKNENTRLDARLRVQRQLLLSRGLTPAQVEAASQGKFVRDIQVVAPAINAEGSQSAAYEVQDLKVQLGEQVQAGQVLGMLADHRLLYLEGRGFKSEAPALAKAAENGWPIQPEFTEEDRSAWPKVDELLKIRHLSNTVDPASRTFGFYIPLTNQSRTYRRDGKTFLVWRFRPGQRVRLHVPIEALKDVLVLPRAAVVHEGPEAYVFRANGDVFDRKPVTVLYQDRRHVVLAQDGSITAGTHVAQNEAAALNRVLKSQQAGEGGHDHHHDH